VRQKLPEISAQVKNDVGVLYTRKEKYTGADIWSFFRDFAAQYMMISYWDVHNGVFYQYANKMVIITDGYLNFTPDIEKMRPPGTFMYINKLRNVNGWQNIFEKYALSPVNQQFINTDILMLEINPVNPTVNINEIEIIKKYWTAWFDKMKVQKVMIYQNSEPIQVIDQALRKFIPDK